MSDIKTDPCSICGQPVEIKKNPITGEAYWWEGNNAEPVNDGRCCDHCNDTVVIPARIKQYMQSHLKVVK